MKRIILFLIWFIALAIYPATAGGIKSSGGKSKKKSEKKIRHTPESKAVLEESQWSPRTERRANFNKTAKVRKKQRKKVKHKSRDFEFAYDSFGRSEGLYKKAENDHRFLSLL